MSNVERRVLVLIVGSGRVLLATATELMGSAAGKVVAPNAPIMDGDVFESARRCVAEQTGLRRLANPEKVAFKQYNCKGGKQILVDVIQAGYEGVPGNTKWLTGPFWPPFHRLPYDRMFKDDQLWLSAVLQGERQHYTFVSEGPDDNKLVRIAPLQQLPTPAF